MQFALTAPASAASVPAIRTNAVDPKIDTASYASILVVDAASGKTLYSMKPGMRWSAASLTKLMTAQVFAAGRRNWTAKGNIRASDEVGGGRLRVPSGSTLSYRDLMYSAIIGSANNAANAMARLSGRGVKGFVAEMNRSSANLGMSNTSYADASGMSPKNVSTAYDIALALDAAARQPEIRKAMVMPSYEFTVATPKKVAKKIINTNRLLFNDQSVVVTSGKTGYLEESMYNFAVGVRPPEVAGRELFVVVLGAPSREESQDTAAVLAEWAWDSFAWNATSSRAVMFARNLHAGDLGADVKTLQRFLNAHGFVVADNGPGSPGRETEKYGPLTKAAVARLQEANSARILEPQGRNQGSGSLDFVTRAWINENF